MATITNVSANRFYSRADNGFCLLPKESKEVTTQHAICYLGSNEIKVEFSSSDDFSNVSELRLLSLKRTLKLDENLSAKDIIKLYMPKKTIKQSLNLPKKTSKKTTSKETKGDKE